MAVGGALGGASVALLAPLVLVGNWEVWLALIACWSCAGLRWGSAPDAVTRRFGPLRYAVPLLAIAAVVVQFQRHLASTREEVIFAARNFYGALRVTEHLDDDAPSRSLTHGQIEHGRQLLDPDQAMTPTTYFAPESGVASAILNHPRRDDGPLRVGVVGLGVGTLAAYGRPGDRFVFWELDPKVERVAREYFTYLDGSPAAIDVRLGDGRLAMERQLRAGDPERFDVLAIDAFNSDAVPVHLLTREAAAVYWSLLEADGILALNVTNRYVELDGVVEALAHDAGAEALLISTPRDAERSVSAARWMLLVRDNATFLARPEVRAAASDPPEGTPRAPWTDDFASLWSVLVISGD